jgi:ATP-dependent RNA helicase TDRD9
MIRSTFHNKFHLQTTQVPKIIVDDCLKQKMSFNILVSQPRKIAAITNSNRVSQEMNRPLGTLVGFQVSLHRALNMVGEKTKVLYCTTGVILQKLLRTKTMKMYSHIILDEIHERDIGEYRIVCCMNA